MCFASPSSRRCECLLRAQINLSLSHTHTLTHYPLAHPAEYECDAVSWGKTGKYLAMGYDRPNNQWTDKGHALCKSQRSWQGMGIGREECKNICEGDPTCGGIFGSLTEATEKSSGVCWMCSVETENCRKLTKGWY